MLALQKSPVSIDWLTLTTWDYPLYLSFASYILQKEPGSWKPSKVMQYRGKTNGAIFFGQGQQRDQDYKDKTHCMIRISGHYAHDFFFTIWRNWPGNEIGHWRCTRLDLEITKLPPQDNDLPKAYKHIRHPKSIIQSKNTTLYIGNRAESPIFLRLYTKLEFLRCELELKHKRARWAYRNLMADGDINAIYKAALKKSRIPKKYFNYFVTPGSVVDYPTEEHSRNMQNRLNWLTSLDETVYQMMHDHDIGEKTRDVIERWAEYSRDIDNDSDVS